MEWTFALTTLDGTSIGQVVRPYERKLSLTLNGLATAQVRFRLDDPLVDEIIALDGDVLLKVYQDSTLRFAGELLTADEVGGWYRRLLSREGLLNVAYVLPSGFEAGTTEAGEIRSSVDTASIAARGQFEEVLPSDLTDSQLRQALADAHVAVRKQAREVVTFDPSAPPSNTPPSVMCNFASPLWRLSKRLIGIPYPSATRYWEDVAANDIIDAWINQANTNNATGIALGTRDTLYAATYGLETPVALKPVSEALTEVQESKVAFPIVAPPAYLALDGFTQTAGALSGKTDDSGNTWSGAGDADDFTINTIDAQARRTATSDASASTGRWAINGHANQASVLVGVDWTISGLTSGHYAGVFARYTDQNNWLLCYIDPFNDTFAIDMKCPTTGHITLGTYDQTNNATFEFSPWTNVFYSIRLIVDDSGNYTAWHYPTGQPTDVPKIYGQHDELATGGDLATGKTGFYDASTSATAATRDYNTFLSSAYTGPQSFDFEVAPLDIGVGGETDLGELNVRTQIGTTTNAVFEYGHGAPTPRFGDDFIVGDYVTGRAIVNGEVRFNGTFRIYGVEISIDENGRVREVPQLIPQ